MSSHPNDAKIADVLRLKRQLKVYFAKKKNNTDPNNISNFRNVLKSLNKEISRYKDRNKKVLFQTIRTKPNETKESKTGNSSKNYKNSGKPENFEFPAFLNDNISILEKENPPKVDEDSKEGIYLQALESNFFNNDKIHFSSDDESYGKFKTPKKNICQETKENEIAHAVNNFGDEFLFDLD